MPLIDKVADYLPSWKASLLNRAGRLILTKVVLTASVIHHLIALDSPRWVIKAIYKKRCGFLWKGQEQANGGNCLVSWEKVQRPLEYGGLGIHNLEFFGWALQCRWLWAQKTDASCPWAGLHIQVPLKAQALFNMATASVLGNGETILFLKDRWLEGKTLAEIAPNLFQSIPKRIVKSRTVAQALSNRRCVSDIKGGLPVEVLMEYLVLWDKIDGVILQHDVPDQYRWKLTQYGIYTSKSTYEACFVGSIKFTPWRKVWRSWAPLRCKFFVWLAVKHRLWMADRLASRGMQHHPACLMCDQAQETTNHLLLLCVFTRQIWFSVFIKLHMAVDVPGN